MNSLLRKPARLVLCAVLTACADDCPSSDPGMGFVNVFSPVATNAPTVKAVYVVPAQVYVGGGMPATFKLRALAEYSDGALREPADGEVSWSLTATSPSQSVSGTGMLGDVSITAPFTGDFDVVAKIGGLTASSTIKPFVAGAQDVVVSGELSSELPSVAIASGFLAGAVCAADANKDLPVAFVRSAPLDVFGPIAMSPCRQDGALFSPVKATWRELMTWKTGPDVLHAAPNGTPRVDPDPIILNARLVIGVTDSYCPDPWGDCFGLAVIQKHAVDQMAESAANANEIFKNSRVGVRLNLPAAAPSDVVEMSGVNDCAAVPKSGPQAPNANELTVYVVDQLVDLPYGLACPETITGANKKVIMIGYRDAWMNSTLVHEIGHALGHVSPEHVNDNITGFGDHNVMSTISVVGADRFHFTVGQSFRLTVDARSWLNTSGLRSGTTETCQCELAETRPCPRLGRDIAPLEKPVSYSGAHTCP